MLPVVLEHFRRKTGYLVTFLHVHAFMMARVEPGCTRGFVRKHAELTRKLLDHRRLRLELFELLPLLEQFRPVSACFL